MDPGKYQGRLGSGERLVLVKVEGHPSVRARAVERRGFEKHCMYSRVQKFEKERIAKPISCRLTPVCRWSRPIWLYQARANPPGSRDAISFNSFIMSDSSCDQETDTVCTLTLRLARLSVPAQNGRDDTLQRGVSYIPSSIECHVGLYHRRCRPIRVNEARARKAYVNGGNDLNII